MMLTHTLVLLSHAAILLAQHRKCHAAIPLEHRTEPTAVPAKSNSIAIATITFVCLGPTLYPCTDLANVGNYDPGVGTAIATIKPADGGPSPG